MKNFQSIILYIERDFGESIDSDLVIDEFYALKHLIAPL